MRPDIVAEPMLRSPRPEMVLESTATAKSTGSNIYFPPGEAGIAKSDAGTDTLARALSIVRLWRASGPAPWGPLSIENGKYTPSTLS
jgi:hypothetical protein